MYCIPVCSSFNDVICFVRRDRYMHVTSLEIPYKTLEPTCTFIAIALIPSRGLFSLECAASEWAFPFEYSQFSPIFAGECWNSVSDHNIVTLISNKKMSRFSDFFCLPTRNRMGSWGGLHSCAPLCKYLFVLFVQKMLYLPTWIAKGGGGGITFHSSLFLKLEDLWILSHNFKTLTWKPTWTCMCRPSTSQRAANTLTGEKQGCNIHQKISC